MGAATRPLRLRTERGTIKLSPSADQQAAATPVSETVGGGNGTTGTASTDRRPPTLVGTSTGGGAGIPGQSSNEPFEVDENDIVRIDTELVTVNMNVIDRNTNRGIVNLTQREFALYEDGVEQTISRFESSSAPFNLILLIDLDRGTLRARINAIDTVPFGDTKLYDATDFTMKEFIKEINNQRRTAIVVMSDGLDGSLPSVRGQGSLLAYEELLRRIQEFDGVIYTLWLNTEYESLSELDTQPEDFDRGQADLGTVYSISYRPTNKGRDGKWRAIRINVARQGAVARGKRGYYAN
jgi:hypothetical protein